MTRRKRRTAEEFGKMLESDPAYQAMMAEKERKREEAWAMYQEAAKGVLEDLIAVGFDVQSVGELARRFARDGVRYRLAIPILMKWLPQVTYAFLKDDIVRTLSVPWAKPAAAPLLIEEYRKLQGPPQAATRWAIGNALEVVAVDSVFEDLVQIATDGRYGSDREMVVLALGKMKNHEAVEVLIRLLDDEDVAGHAVTALGKLKAPEALPHLERFVKHPKDWIRKEAQKAIKRIEKASSRG